MSFSYVYKERGRNLTIVNQFSLLDSRVARYNLPPLSGPGNTRLKYNLKNIDTTYFLVPVNDA